MEYLRRVIRKIILEDLSRETSPLSKIPGYAVGVPIDISDALRDPSNVLLRDQVWSILSFSYKGDNSFYGGSEDLLSHNFNRFFAYDVNGNGDINVLFCGWLSRKSSYGKVKMVQSGSDGQPDSVQFYKKELVRWIESGEAILEASGAPAAILMKAGVPAMDEKTVRKYFPKPKKQWFGKHPYPQSRDAQNAEKYGPRGEYDMWCGRNFMGGKSIVKLWFGDLSLRE